MIPYYFYTDGSALGNPGPGGISTVLVRDNKIIMGLYQSSKATTTNNRMELQAVILTFEIIYKCLDLNDIVYIISDSNYVVKKFCKD